MRSPIFSDLTNGLCIQPFKIHFLKDSRSKHHKCKLQIALDMQAGLCRCRSNMLNPLMTNENSHHYHLDESIFIFRGIRSDLFIFYSFFDENHVSKQNSPRWDAAFCGVTSAAILFAYVPQKGCQAYMG